jgi:hypothetical protein
MPPRPFPGTDTLPGSFLKALGDFLRGLFLYGLQEDMCGEKRRQENLFMLGLFGPMIGFPRLFNYYHLRLMPHCVNRLHHWKRRVLKERDFFDHVKD